MSDMPKNRHLRFLLKLFYVIFGVVVFYVVYKYLFWWLLPFIISFLVAMAIQRPVRFLCERWHFSKKLACLAMIFFTYGIVGAAIFGIVYGFIHELSDFIATLPEALSDLPQVLTQVSATLTRYLRMITGKTFDIGAALTEALAGLAGSSIDMSSVFGTVKDVAFSIPTILIFVIALFVGTFYISSDFTGIRDFILAQFPERVQESAVRLTRHLMKTLGNWCKAIGIMIFITFFELLIGFLLMRMEYAGVLAAAIAIVDALPVFGAGTVLIPWAIYSLVTGAYMRSLYLALLYVVIVIVRNSVEPKILGTRIGLHPLLMLMCLYLGYVTLGLLGMFVLPVCLIAIERLQAWGYIHLYKIPASMQNHDDFPDPVETIKETIKKKAQAHKNK